MQSIRVTVLSAALACGLPAYAQLANEVQLKIDPSNRTLSVSAEERVTVDPDVAILHIGFETKVMDAKSAYGEGARISNAIVSALKQAGVPETSIRSEWQRLERDYQNPHKFKLEQGWTVKTPPARVAEILDVAVTAGATDSGQIDWTVEDVRALEGQALEQATARARDNAAALAKGMGVKLGALVYATNQIGQREAVTVAYANDSNNAPRAGMAVTPPLAIEPRKVSRTAAVYAVYAID